jgi:hypothetical protein
MSLTKTSSVRDIVDFNALLLRWPGCRAVHLDQLAMKSEPLVFQPFRIGLPEYNVKDQCLYYQMTPLRSLAELSGQPDYDRVTIKNDTESCMKIEDSIQTLGGSASSSSKSRNMKKITTKSSVLK